MGYLSHKKKEERINLFLNTALFLTGLYSFLVLFDEQGDVLDHFLRWHFQYYLVMQVLFLYALFVKRFGRSLLFLFFILINFVMLSSSGNLFFNTASEGTTTLNIIYQNHAKEAETIIKQAYAEDGEILALNVDKPLPPVYDDNYRLYHEEAGQGSSLILSDLPPEQAGKVSFSPKRQASYISVNKNGQKIMVVNIDFSNLKKEEEKNVFKNLEEFVLAQNIPLVIIGDFGMPAGMPIFKNFMIRTGLEVKNRVILSNGRQWFNPFVLPTINVLGYKAMGLDVVERLEKSPSGSYPFLFRVKL